MLTKPCPRPETELKGVFTKTKRKTQGYRLVRTELKIEMIVFPIFIL